jgi:hypothetical protein
LFVCLFPRCAMASMPNEYGRKTTIPNPHSNE